MSFRFCAAAGGLFAAFAVTGCLQEPQPASRPMQASAQQESAVSDTEKLRFSAQPAPESFAALRNEGVDIVVNLRETDELEWDEAALVASAGMQYSQIPISRTGAAFSPAAIEAINRIVAENPDSDILLHCASGNRVAAWYATYLVEQRGLGVEDALRVARQRGLTRPGLEQRVRAYLARADAQ